MCVIWCQSIHVLFFISKSCKGIVLFIQDFCRVSRSEISPNCVLSQYQWVGFDTVHGTT